LEKKSTYFFIALLCFAYDSVSLLFQSFAKFFSDEIHKLHTSLLINCISASPYFPPPFTPLTFLPSLVLSLMKFLNFSLSLLTLIVIWILLIHLSRNNALISYCPISLTYSICLSLLAFFLINSKTVCTSLPMPGSDSIFVLSQVAWRKLSLTFPLSLTFLHDHQCAQNSQMTSP